MVDASSIRAARASKGESQEAFGRRFGVDQSTIHRWETDGPPKRGPGKLAIEAIIAEMHEAAE